MEASAAAPREPSHWKALAIPNGVIPENLKHIFEPAGRSRMKR